LKIHKELPDVATLVGELTDIRAEVDDSGYWRFGARADRHDDLVLALGIALWRSHGDGSTGIIEYYRREMMGYDWGTAKPAASFVRLRVRGDCSHVIPSSLHHDVGSSGGDRRGLDD
jgi:hypothetical protein